MSACLLCECLVSAVTKTGAISPVNEVACVVKCHTGDGNLLPVPGSTASVPYCGAVTPDTYLLPLTLCCNDIGGTACAYEDVSMKV